MIIDQAALPQILDSARPPEQMASVDFDLQGQRIGTERPTVQ
jgi:hypothetical protein